MDSVDIDDAFLEKCRSFQQMADIRFDNPNLLAIALTHSSYANQRRTPKQSNERLEFFGDSVLKLVVSAYLFKKFPECSEGELTKIRARLISDNLLASFASVLGLGAYIRFSTGELQSGGASRTSNLANTFEAILGAYFLDQGLEAVQQFLVPKLDLALVDGLKSVAFDAKTDLQELIQKFGSPLPLYEVVSQTGPEHAKQFEIRVTAIVGNHSEVFYGTGTTKKSAEQSAALTALSVLSKKPLR